MSKIDFAPRSGEAMGSFPQAASNPFYAAMQAAGASDPLDRHNLSQIEKPKTEKDKHVPLDDNPGRRTNPNFHIHPEFQRMPWTFFGDFFRGTPSGALESINK